MSDADLQLVTVDARSAREHRVILPLDDVRRAALDRLLKTGKFWLVAESDMRTGITDCWLERK